MIFLNPWLLVGLAGVAAPIVIHLVRRRAAKPVDWGAMRFLRDTVSQRRRRMEWEDLLLMAARCLLLALLALALARPFLTPDARVPWAFVLPAGLAGVALLGASFVLASVKWRWLLRFGALVLLLAAGGMAAFERVWHLNRFQSAGARDVVLVIDTSSSMAVRRAGGDAFSRAVEEAREIVRRAPRGTAFSVISGGPAPLALSPGPLSQRAEVLGLLDELELAGGPFRSHEALGLATLQLAEGDNPGKDIIVFTDAQRAGWRMENEGAWRGLEEAWDGMRARPRLLLRDFGAPSPFRNAALVSLEASRPVIGTDREVTLRLVVENTGDEALAPGVLRLEIGGEVVDERELGLLAPGQAETVEFAHHFREAGPQVVGASITGGDDLADDDRIDRVFAIREALEILLVDGNPRGGFFERAAGYAALALAPGELTGEGLAAGGEGFLMRPRLVAATALAEEDLRGAAVVVLADVARLPEALARALASRVAEGAGLVVAAGPRASPEFYNAWEGPEGLLMPLELGEERVNEAGLGPLASSFFHESLAWAAGGSDLESARFTRWRSARTVADGAALGATLANGDAWLASRAYGGGRCLLLTTALDARGGSLPARRAFVPLIHELVTWAAGTGTEWNVAAAWSPRVVLERSRGGLGARYFRREAGQNEEPLLGRVDSLVAFDWRESPPHPALGGDPFRVEWSGTLLPPRSGDYQLDVEMSGRIEVLAGEDTRMTRGGDGGLGRLQLREGEELPLRIVFRSDGPEPRVSLFWRPPGGRRQLLPTSVLRPDESTSRQPWRAIDPRGGERAAWLTSGPGGRDLAVEGVASPGVYRLFPVAGGEDLALVVTGDPAESRFEPLTAEDFERLAASTELVRPGSAADVVAVLDGRGFGREIWRWLAVAALLALVVESALARWVSRSRGMAEETPLAFGEETVWGGGGR